MPGLSLVCEVAPSGGNSVRPCSPGLCVKRPPAWRLLRGPVGPRGRLQALPPFTPLPWRQPGVAARLIKSRQWARGASIAQVESAPGAMERPSDMVPHLSVVKPVSDSRQHG